MIDYKYSELFQKNSVDKQFRIEFDGGVITNTELHFENFELNESICSDNELRFGSCEASSIKFKISNIFTPLKNKWLAVSITLDGNTDNPFILGNYKVYSDVPTADKRYREVTAYDIMYDILNTDVSTWYESLKFPMTLKNFRNIFLSYFGIEQEEVNLPQDEMTVEKTVSPSSMSGKDVILSICEINGCFGKIGRDGKFKYVFLKQDIHGLYPDNDLYPGNTLFPRNSDSIKIPNNIYITCTYEDFVTQRIDKLQIRQSENDVGSIVGTGNNCYIVQNNFLVYGKNTDELKEIAEKLFEEIKNISYRPFNATKLGNPCLETGDAIRIVTKYELVESYIFKRTIKGIQSLRESISSSGVYEYSEKVNSVNSSIIQLKGKTNELERNVEETKSTITDVEKGLESKITQTSSSLSAEIEDTKNGLESQIAQTSSSLSAEIEDTKNGLSSRIEQTVKSITLEISNGEKTAGIVIAFENEKGQKQEVSGKIEMTGIVTFNNLSESGQTVINGSNITTGTIDATKVNVVNVKAASVDAENITGKTISGKTITGADIQANTFTVVDKIAMTNSNETKDIMTVTFDSDPDSLIFPLWCIFDNDVECSKDLDVCGNLYCDKSITAETNIVTGGNNRPDSDEYSLLGTKNYRWKEIWCTQSSISSTSDAREKNTINYMNEQVKLSNFFMSLKPCTYKFNNGESGRTHYGYISQDVEQALIDNDMTALDFAGFCRDVKTEITIDEDGKEIEKPVLDENGKEQYMYSLRYSEFIALNTHMLQKAYKKIEQQQKEIDDLKGTVSFLMEKLERLGV